MVCVCVFYGRKEWGGCRPDGQPGASGEEISVGGGQGPELSDVPKPKETGRGFL